MKFQINLKLNKPNVGDVIFSSDGRTAYMIFKDCDNDGYGVLNLNDGHEVGYWNHLTELIIDFIKDDDIVINNEKLQLVEID